jgi:3-deoxy-D-manno-octulosonic-acid transferase
MFVYLYSTFAILIYIILLPFLLLLSLKPKYHQSIPARFFLYKNPPLKPNGIWFHSCSFGEAKALLPLVDNLPKELLRMSTTTDTGKQVIDTYTSQSRYLPFEILLFGWIKKQQTLVVMEAEFWYLMFFLAKKRGAKTLLINARMSDKSYPKYYKMRWFYKKLFRYVDVVFAQSDTDAKRLRSLGAKDVRVTGNIKLSNLPKPTKILSKPDALVVCGASTHQNEEQLILQSFIKLKEQNSSAKLIIVPRHPQRFDEVAKLAKNIANQHNLSIHRYSNQMDLESDIVVVDMLGELVNIYAISDIVILGGAFESIGGHNGAEAAQFGCKIISGEHYFNQKDIFNAIENIKIIPKEQLSATLLNHKELKPTKITQSVDITPILDEIKV